MYAKKIFLTSLLLISLSFAFKAHSLNTENILTKAIAISDQDIDNYWTPERMKNAKPMPLPTVNHSKRSDADSTHMPSFNTNSIGADARPPVINIKPNFKRLYMPEKNKSKMINQSFEKTAFDHGTLNEQYTSSQLVPITIDVFFPYRAVGKLFFTIPDEGDFVCSAAVLRARVILTAGHCVHSGSGGVDGFYTNWKFVPAFRDGAAPFETWNARFAATTLIWATGDGEVPNAADYALLEPSDKRIDGIVHKIGLVTGYFGYQTSILIPNHAHMLGYPCNLDNCEKMHVVSAQSVRREDPNNVEYGSDMGGGSSGGPWVQNFGATSEGQLGGLNAGRNRIIGVTSYGYVSPDPKAQGASIPDDTFIDLLNFVCSHRRGNC